ncbi:cystathionine beta-lyase [uncultured Bartonella sp.]|uniref:cystathionine beta-lyase n=1 Tax=uncultured Bartonella sp. TaxID=104108 RepID=UPI002631C854|nr:cystathionine beta-lyase [uncultured Bartonella sp.]
MTSAKIFSHAGINTQLAHNGNNPQDYFGFVNPPVVHASTVLFPDAETLKNEQQRYTYGTHGTPTTDALCHAVDQLEGSVKTVLVPSGLAAITVPLLGALGSGDHALIVDSVYGPTRRFANTILKKCGIEVEYYDPLIGKSIEQLMKPNTKVVFTESPGSNTFEIQDIPAIAQIAHTYGALVLMDNTWATPVYFKPLKHGVDISIMAATKYPAGHSDILMGFISANERAKNIVERAHMVLGMCVSGDDAYNTLRSMRTLGIRLGHQSKTAFDLARWLETMPQVAKVLHPALTRHVGHDIWQRDFSGASSLFSIVLKGGGEKEAHAFLNALNIFGLGYSWGGYESLAVEVNLEDRTIKRKYSGPILRLQIGIEDFDDLKADIEQALIATKL